MDELRTNFGEVLKQSRTVAGLTQHELSEMVMIPPKLVHYYEQGIREPSIGIAILLADALEFNINDVYHM